MSSKGKPQTILKVSRQAGDKEDDDAKSDTFPDHTGKDESLGLLLCDSSPQMRAFEEATELSLPQDLDHKGAGRREEEPRSVRVFSILACVCLLVVPLVSLVLLPQFPQASTRRRSPASTSTSRPDSSPASASTSRPNSTGALRSHRAHAALSHQSPGYASEDSTPKRKNLGRLSQRVSDAPLLTFYMYRAQSDQNYAPENQNMGNLGGVLWYLQNEIIWHRDRLGTYTKRSGSAKTRIERWRVQTRAPEELFMRGMNFGVVNVYDFGQCTGPFKCENLKFYGPTVGCESWTRHADFGTKSWRWRGNTFPHQMWIPKKNEKYPKRHYNHYPGALWYSLPGACSAKKVWAKDKLCEQREPSGACPPGVTPTGEWNCTFSYEKMGEVRIDELEGIKDLSAFLRYGGREYDKLSDKGTHMNFWNNKGSFQACQERIDKLRSLFQKKYPDAPDYEDPVCDFDVRKFYPYWPKGSVFGDIDGSRRRESTEVLWG